MISGANRIAIDSMQEMRIKEHPFQSDETLVVFDNLEVGSLKLYEPLNGSVMIQEILANQKIVGNAVLIAEAVINSSWKDNGVYIHKIFYEYGHENLVHPMLEQIIHFAGFYDCYQSVGISELEYEKCLPYAKDALANLKKENRVYEYLINRE